MQPFVQPAKSQASFGPPVHIALTPSAPYQDMAVTHFCWFLILLQMTIIPFSSQVANCVLPTLMMSLMGAACPLN